MPISGTQLWEIHWAAQLSQVVSASEHTKKITLLLQVLKVMCVIV